MSDNITLPREVVERARKALKPLDHYMTVYDRDEIADTLRAALAAPPSTHPGYIIGSHWLETAYSRICAGEAEADVLRDIGLVRITDGTVQTADIHAIVDRQEALRRDAERYRWMTENHPEHETRSRVYSVTLLFNAYQKEHIDAAIDAAMGDKR